MTVRFVFTGIDTDVFPADYARARQRWLQQLNTLPYPPQVGFYPCAGAGPDGESLQTDTVWIGDKEASNVVVVIAGTHGVEGFAGSAVQIDLLRLLTEFDLVIPEQTALLLVHALTPWGYAWSRRCDNDGVDLNRNVVDFSQPLPETPEYLLLRSALFTTDDEERRRALLAFGETHGRVVLEKAVSGGQYLDPAGPFYGGNKPAHGRLVCEALIQAYDLAQRRVAVVDLHTGLGSYGYGEIICDHAPDSAGAAVARQWYGDSVTLPLAGTSSSVPKLGLLDYLWHAVMGDSGCYITLEFGTYSTEQLFDVLLRDHQLWSQSGNESERIVHSKLMRRHFNPADPAWREMVLFRGRQVIVQALRGVSS
ncbi:MAG: M14 family metallopeptidase [Methylomonas sp.]|jgi:predicted deacylase|uniref:DUF2817 domain-containing protein n=1 Tax=Methylomonas sp. TaxID=418 RepID=UPI0025FFB75F|nr:DUF2817 domain-containing protein [Methylomonas sp.]MCK9605963.1 M14 family metallopeptidase [Methylomonas sp.]